MIIRDRMSQLRRMMMMRNEMYLSNDIIIDKIIMKFVEMIVVTML